jgi:hypothetical protein
VLFTCRIAAGVEKPQHTSAPNTSGLYAGCNESPLLLLLLLLPSKGIPNATALAPANTFLFV